MTLPFSHVTDYTSQYHSVTSCRGSIAPFSHTTIEGASELVENTTLKEQKTQHATIV